jgi:hypothetical protein
MQEDSGEYDGNFLPVIATSGKLPETFGLVMLRRGWVSGDPMVAAHSAGHGLECGSMVEHLLGLIPITARKRGRD